MKDYYVYIMASIKGGVLYIGVTNDLVRRVYEHKQSLVKGFTSQYKTFKLVYFENTTDVMSALTKKSNLRNGIELGKWI